jgi:putative endonuclease
MVSKQEIGNSAEILAKKYLVKLGYKILDTNWHSGRLELDIIALDRDELVVVEVKSRSGNRYEHPAEAVTNAKIRHLIEAAEAYILKNDINIETRFDIITVIFFDKKFELEHFKNAFYPTL